MLTDAVLTDAVLTDAVLTDAVLTDAVLTDAVFANVVSTDVDMSTPLIKCRASRALSAGRKCEREFHICDYVRAVIKGAHPSCAWTSLGRSRACFQVNTGDAGNGNVWCLDGRSGDSVGQPPRWDVPFDSGTALFDDAQPGLPACTDRCSPVDGLHGTGRAHVDGQQESGSAMTPSQAEVPYGALDLMILRTLDSLGAQHGYGIARRIEQVAEGMLALNQGTIYPALLRLEQKGWIASEWGTSENNRRARFYSITRAGRKQLAAEADLWARTVAMMNRLLEDPS